MKETDDLDGISSADEQALLILDSAGRFVKANQAATEIFGYDADELLTMRLADILADPSVEAGREFEQELNGEIAENERRIVQADGTTARISTHLEPVTVNGEGHLKVLLELKNPVSKAPDLDEISPEEMTEIVKNLRIDAPGGKMTLEEVMLDLTVGHNELEQYKQGALSLHKAIDERLQEEEGHNRNSKECQVLRDVKESAFGLYLRVQRGDQELHGNRDGQYSGYFD